MSSPKSQSVAASQPHLTREISSRSAAPEFSGFKVDIACVKSSPHILRASDGKPSLILSNLFRSSVGSIPVLLEEEISSFCTKIRDVERHAKCHHAGRWHETITVTYIKTIAMTEDQSKRALRKSFHSLDKSGRLLYTLKFSAPTRVLLESASLCLRLKLPLTPFSHMLMSTRRQMAQEMLVQPPCKSSKIVTPLVH